MNDKEHYSAEFLLEVARSAAIPGKIADEATWWCDVTFVAKDGWRVVVYFDGEEMDNIEHFVSPAGETVDWFWAEGRGDDWPDDAGAPVRNYRVM